MADQFWKRWRTQYLQTLKSKTKWQNVEPNIKNGDIIILKDLTTHRNNWPPGLVINAIKSDDGLVRKAVIRVTNDGKTTLHTRPISEMVLLTTED